MADLTFTTIEEPARAALEITRDDYALCNYIQTWSSHPGNKQPGYCDRTRQQMADFIGVTTRGVMKMLDRLERVGLVERMSEKRFLHRITMRWFDTVTLAKAERKGEQSSLLKENKVPPKGEQSSPLKENKVPPHKDIYKESKDFNKEEKNAENPLSPPFTKVDEIYPDLIVTRFNPETPNERVVEGLSLEAEKEKNVPPVAPAPPAKPRASKTQAEIEAAQSVIEYLNQKSGRSFRANTNENAKGIIGQLRQGFSVEQMQKVIDYKIKDWGKDAKMAEHLNPITLFRPSNFERYLVAAELPPIPQGPNNNYTANGRSHINQAGGDLSKYNEKQIF